MTARSLCLALLVAASCSGKSSPSAGPPAGSGTKRATGPYVMPADAPDGLDVKVSNGKAGPVPYDRAKLAPARKLGNAEANALLARSKPLQKDPDDQQPFALRPGSQPPPRTGTTLTGQFPPPPSSLLPPKSTDAGKELRVLRYMPEGKVPLAPELSITFSQPMVAVTSQGDAAGTVPVKLAPPSKGKWRWIGTRTILFDPDGRFPQATTYTVEIPAGTKSTQGNALAKATTFSFETPTVQVVSAYPSQYEPQHVDVPMFLLFDQKIDPQAVLAKLEVTAGTQKFDLQMLDAKAIAGDKRLAALVESAHHEEQDGRWLAFRATQKFPTDTVVTIEIPTGTPSGEGRNLTKAPQTRTFRTYPPLHIAARDCDYYAHRCVPGQALVIDSNNALDDDKFDEQLVSVSPALPKAKIYVSGAALVIEGPTKARTQYKIAVGKKLTDEFGQELGKDQTVTFQVGDAYPTFFGPSGVVVLDPAAPKPTLDFFTTNYEQLKVKLYRVTPSDFTAYGNFLQNQWNHDKPPPVPGTKVFDQLVKTKPGKNELVETSVELAPALAGGLGHAIAIVEPYPWKEKYEPPRLISWVQSTKLAVDAYVDADQLIGFSTDLATGKPASGVALELRPFGTTATSDDKGMATIALPPVGGTKGVHMLLAKRGEDTAFVAEGYGYDYGTWYKQVRPRTLAWYVIDDRKMYKPGEEVSLKGWLRAIDQGKEGDVGGLRADVAAVTYEVHDSQGNQIATGTAQLSFAGGFDAKFTLPKTPNLGNAWIDFKTQGKDVWNGGGDTYHHGFQIEEFRRPEFEVSANASQGPFLVGDSGDVTVSAKYYAGGGLPAAPVQWTVTASPTSYTPPNRDDYIFGQWVPWWNYHTSFDDEGDGPWGRGGRYQAPKSWSLAAKTDANGAHILHLDFLSVKPALPMAVTTTANVTDVNRQTWSASAPLIVHPADYYVGLKTKKPFVEKGTPFDIDVIGVDLDGKMVPGAKITLQTVRLDYEVVHGQYKTKEVEPQSCTVIATRDAQACHFATAEGGTYQTTATIIDQRGRPNTTKLTFWVAGGKQPGARDVAQERINLIPDKKEYAPGSTAELLVQAPFYPAEALVSWRRSGIVKTERISIAGPTHVIKVPISDAMTPNLYVQVDLVGMAARLDDKGDPDPKLPKRPAYAVGTIDLPIPPKQRTLAVTVKPNAPKLAPGETAKLAVTVRDAQGKVVPEVEAAVIVVDEAILSLTGYQFPTPIDTFYAQRGADARDYYSQSYIKLARPDTTVVTGGGVGGVAGYKDGALARASGKTERRLDLVTETPAPTSPAAAEAARPMQAPTNELAQPLEKKKANKGEEGEFAGTDGKDSGGAAIAIRSNFNPLAAFSPVVKTDSSGKATVEVKLPDNLTRYRIIAVAVAGDKQFGKGESSLVARLPLMVRPSPPRFLNFGDTFKLPVVVQNQTDAPMTVKLAARTTNAQLTDGTGREVTVPANDRVEVLFPAAAEMAGTARFQFVGTAGAASDAAELALPVWTPATTEAFATYGVIDDGAIKQAVALPGKVVTQFGGVEVTTASTNLQALTDAMLYLVHYPFDCAEQRSSRVMAIAALRDVLTAFKTKDMPSQAAMEASVEADLEHLSQMQNGDGGFAFWDRGHPSEPYLTVYVTSALVHARDKGYPVDAAMLGRAKAYLQTIENRYPWYYDADIRHTISSYALYTRKLMGDVDIAKGKKLIAEAGGVAKLSMEANAWLLGTLAGNGAAAAERAAIVRLAMNKVSETAGAANFTTAYGDGAYLLLASDRRVDAVMLESLIQEQKDNDLIPKLVTGLLAHRTAGRWLNTQENTFALLAMDLYFRTYEKTTPDFVARVWLGNDYAGEHAFKGRSTDYFAIPIPMKQVAAHDKQDLTIQKDGAGRLYYRIGMTYAPASLKLEPADYGFVVERTYEGADDPKDVTRVQDGTWHVKAGARVRVKLKLVNENRRYHVALVDPMPAGFEAMNPALAVTGPIPTDPTEQQSRGAYWWWYGPWYEHQNMRDERVEAFAALLWEGVHDYEYVARATTPGNFVVPPPKAEEMYMPETFGRGGSDRVIVE